MQIRKHRIVILRISCSIDEVLTGSLVLALTVKQVRALWPDLL